MPASTAMKSPRGEYAGSVKALAQAGSCATSSMIVQLRSVKRSSPRRAPAMSAIVDRFGPSPLSGLEYELWT